MTSRIYLQQNVWDAALDRIRWVFDEFEHVYVSFSGGKDSTVTMQMALIVAEEKGRLPLNVMFIDQEAEWQATIDYVRLTMDNPKVKAHWLQVPIRLFNATSADQPWLHCWEPGKKWIHPRQPDSLHANVYGTDRFKNLFNQFLKYNHPTEKACSLAGVRCEESPARTLGLTIGDKYKGETWGARLQHKGHYVFYPLYDFSYTDVWKSIHDNHWPYCRLYDAMYQYGIPTPKMRVSNVHHETAVVSLYYLQEIEGDTWNRVTERVSGVNSAKHLNKDFGGPKKLPPMFADWIEYRDYLLEHMIPDPKHQRTMRRQFALMDRRYDEPILSKLIRTEIQAILVNDYHNTLLGNFTAAHFWAIRNRGSSGRRDMEDRR